MDQVTTEAPSSNVEPHKYSTEEISRRMDEICRHASSRTDLCEAKKDRLIVLEIEYGKRKKIDNYRYI